jgi:hypothetical protein
MTLPRGIAASHSTLCCTFCQAASTFCVRARTSLARRRHVIPMLVCSKVTRVCEPTRAGSSPARFLDAWHLFRSCHYLCLHSPSQSREMARQLQRSRATSLHRPYDGIEGPCQTLQNRQMVLIATKVVHHDLLACPVDVKAPSSPAQQQIKSLLLSATVCDPFPCVGEIAPGTG